MLKTWFIESALWNSRTNAGDICLINGEQIQLKFEEALRDDTKC